MRLGDLLNQLDKFYEHKTIEMKEGYVLLPKCHSYRGDYRQLAIDFTFIPDYEITVKQLKEALYDAYVDGIMEGYKGGEYPIHKDTNVVIASYGDSEGFHIAEFFEREDSVYLATAEMY